MECINTISYSILVNGESKGIITSSRALRQGDSLSPFLFLFCVEGLDAILRKLAGEGDIKGFFSMQEWSKTYSFFFSLMIARFSADQPWRNVRKFKLCLFIMRLHMAK